MSEPIPGTPAESTGALRCDACPRACSLEPGQHGACRARWNDDGRIVPSNYGRITSLALDPIEKKPLRNFMPGSLVVSMGNYGCNLRCPFCQNYSISQADDRDVPWKTISPTELVALTSRQRERNRQVVGIAYTYNEPVVGWEYVRDCARLAHESGLVNVLVSNGCATERVITELAPLIDAANIDLKAFDPAFYRHCGAPGDGTSVFEAVKRTIELLAAEPGCHLEVTTLIIPGMNDRAAQIEREARWLADIDVNIPLHITRFFPRWHMEGSKPTPVKTVHRLADIARVHLAHVYVGNC